MSELVTGIHEFGPFNVENTLRRVQITGNSHPGYFGDGDTPFGGDVVGDIYLTQEPSGNPLDEGRQVGSVDVDADAGGGIVNSDYIEIDPSKLDPSKEKAYLYIARGGKTDFLGNALVNAPDGFDPLGDRDESVVPDESHEETPDPADQPGLVHADNEQGYALAPSMEDDYSDADALIEDAQDGTLDQLNEDSGDSGGLGSESSTDSTTSDSSGSDSTASDGSMSASSPSVGSREIAAGGAAAVFLAAYYYTS